MEGAGVWKERNVKIIGLSCDTVKDNTEWVKDLEESPFQNYLCDKQGYCAFRPPFEKFPIICDEDRKVAELYGMWDAEEKNMAGLPMTARAVFIIGPDHKLKASILYPATTGRNISEIVRLVEALQLSAEQSLATPVNWMKGEPLMVPPSNKTFEDFEVVPVKSGRSYLKVHFSQEHVDENDLPRSV